MSIQEKNYLNPQQIEQFIEILPRVISTRKRFNAVDIQMMVRIQYGSALRINEVLTLTPDDIDVDNSIITLNHTKTGFKKGKCSTWDYKDAHARTKTKLVHVDSNCKKCIGIGKFRVPQFTTINPKDIAKIRQYLEDKPKYKPLFQITSKTAWK